MTLVGCQTHNDAEAYFRDKARLSGEAHKVWARPTEVGFDILDGEIVGESVSTSVIWGAFYNGASSGGIGDALVAIVNAVTGHSGISIEDPGVQAAAADAVSKANGADGIYMTQETDTGTSVLWGIYSYRKVTVRGRPMKLKVMGQVAQDRADKERYLNAIGGGNSADRLPGRCHQGASIKWQERLKSFRAGGETSGFRRPFDFLPRRYNAAPHAAYDSFSAAPSRYIRRKSPRNPSMEFRTTYFASRNRQ